MGRYSSYAKRIDTLARERFSEYEKATAAYEKAKKERNSKPYLNGGWGVTPEMQLEAKKAEVKYLEAEATLREVKLLFKSTIEEAKAIREELLEEVTKATAINPEDLDRSVVDVLKSGICSAAEVKDLYDKAENITTKRYIAKHAAEEVERNNNSVMDVHKRRSVNEILNNVVADSRAYADPANSETMKIFDSVNGVLTRCVNNPNMSTHWGELTETALSEL